ncbi:Protein of uncharacterised function (DUF2971) [Klebsiella pneumoniae]|uniref:DUF2971 domain-containing protein n=1 Tax=Klebsiella pneumoniae TaxID=573 RepID=UPI000E2BF74B|nr:DUF2971 domain-containing protein [Klebsiella pneumoniae]SWO46975.1 Protein of uncharacterised function (DUF2971) [Klebsiella pneumoniae]DAL00197.1 MAG TPA: Protein of unknown function (DUF2971) [Caudoviricetes sp.]
MKKIDDKNFDPADIINRAKLLIERFASPPSMDGVSLFRPKKIPPKFLYKYTSTGTAKKILNGMSFRYTQRKHLDDALEESIDRDQISRTLPGFEDGPTMVIDVFDSDDLLSRFDQIKSFRSSLRHNGETLLDDIPIITANGIHSEYKYEKGNRILRHILEDSVEPLAFSLTENINSLRMWAEYGDEHHGVCFELNTRSKYFISNRDLIGRPGYFAPVVYRALTAEDYAYRFPSERFFIKTEDWADQREWRRVEYVDNKKFIEEPNKPFVFPFPPEIITSIFFGQRCDESKIKEIIELARAKNELNHIIFYKTKRTINQLILEKI